MVCIMGSIVCIMGVYGANVLSDGPKTRRRWPRMASYDGNLWYHIMGVYGIIWIRCMIRMMSEGSMLRQKGWVSVSSTSRIHGAIYAI